MKTAKFSKIVLLALSISFFLLFLKSDYSLFRKAKYEYSSVRQLYDKQLKIDICNSAKGNSSGIVGEINNLTNQYSNYLLVNNSTEYSVRLKILI